MPVIPSSSQQICNFNNVTLQVTNCKNVVLYDSISYSVFGIGAIYGTNGSYQLWQAMRA